MIEKSWIYNHKILGGPQTTEGVVQSLRKKKLKSGGVLTMARNISVSGPDWRLRHLPFLPGFLFFDIPGRTPGYENHRPLVCQAIQIGCCSFQNVLYASNNRLKGKTNSSKGKVAENRWDELQRGTLWGNIYVYLLERSEHVLMNLPPNYQDTGSYSRVGDMGRVLCRFGMGGGKWGWRKQGRTMRQ